MTGQINAALSHEGAVERGGLHTGAWERYASWAVTVAATVLAGTICFFVDRVPWWDERGLYNPVYMTVEHGEMTYPAHLEFSGMAVHPPLHYGWIAAGMSLGLSVFHAAGLPTFALALVAMALILTSDFPIWARFGLLLGMVSGTSTPRRDWSIIETGSATRHKSGWAGTKGQPTLACCQPVH